MIIRSDRTNEIQPSQIEHREAEERHVSPSWLARHWNVHIDTIYRDIRKGALPASRLPGGQLRIRWADAKKYGRPVE
jgi:excisionase family DNA binding protein